MSLIATLKKKKSFELFFIVVLLIIGTITCLTLIRSFGVSQRGVFFTDQTDYFMDFYNHIKYTSLRDPYNDTYLNVFEKTYPPLPYLILYPFSKIFDFINQNPGGARSTQLGIMSVVLFLVFSSITFATLLNEAKNGSKAVRFFTVLTLFISGISLFSLERANIIYLAVIGAAFFILFYKSNNKILREISLIALAFAFSIKIYPAIFGLLLLYEKRFKDVLRLIIYSLILFFLPFLFFNGGFSNFGLLIQNVKQNTTFYMFSSAFYRFGFIPEGIFLNLKKPIINVLFYFGVGLFFLTALTSWSLKKHWKTVLLLSCSLVLTPSWSGFYCGLYLFIPIILFLNDEEHTLRDWIYLILILVVLSPYQIYNGKIPISSWISNTSLIVLYLILCIESFLSTIKFFTAYINNNKLKKIYPS